MRSCCGTALALCLAAPATTQETTGALPTAATTAPVVLAGRVVDWQGQPIADAAVGWLPSHTTTTELLAAPPVRTDADGRFELPVVPPDAGTHERPALVVACKAKAAISVQPQFATIDDADGTGRLEPPDDDAEHPVRYQPRTDVGDLVLAEGARLFGRVRDAGGQPLVGVLVTATDVLPDARQGASTSICTTRSEANGIFNLPCALPQGVALTFALAGHYTESLQPVAAGSPLELTLTRSGFVAGRVLDGDGKGVDQAWVSVAYERRDGQEGLRTGADGSFRFTLAQRGRWRVLVSRRDRHETQAAHSAVFAEPRDNLEIQLAPRDSKTGAAAHLLVRAVDKKTGKPVERFAAAAVWNQYANDNANYRDYVLRMGLRRGKPASDGSLEVAGPGDGDAEQGCVRVLAAGYAATTMTGVEWQDDPDQARPPLVVELESEATIHGHVRDDRTGEPVAGARVWARLPQNQNQGSYENFASGWPDDAVATAADGSFVLRGLGEGEWQLRTRHPQRPPAEDATVTLTTAEARTGTVIPIPGGARVGGRITGMAIPRGARVFLHELPRQSFGEPQNHWYAHTYGQTDPGDRTVPVGDDGSFGFEGVKLENHLLVLVLPSPPRLGGNLYVPLEPFRVRRQGVQRDFDASEDQPGTIRGRITFPGTAVPTERLLVVARTVADEGQRFFNAWGNQLAGLRAFVAADGTFSLRTGPGNYQLDVHDLASNVRLLSDKTVLRVRTGEVITKDLQPRLQTIRVKLEPEPGVDPIADVDRLELRVVPKDQQEAAGMFGGNDHHDFGVGLPVPCGCRELDVVLPAADVTFLLRNNASAIRIDEQRWQVPPLGRAEFEVVDGKDARTECMIRIGAPPELPDPKADANAADTGKDDADK